jgi:hypothetical protein
MYVSTDIYARSCNHCSLVKAISITYSEGVSVALSIQDEMHMHDIVGCGLPDSAIFLHII